MNSTYARDGVDTHAEASCSRYAAEMCKRTYAHSPFVTVHDLSEGHFRGPRPFSLTGLPNGFVTEISSDGIGTKSILIDAARTHHTAGYDLVAMVASDITRYGGIPLVLTNVLDIVSVGTSESPERQAYTQLIDGLGNALKEVRAVGLKGETAQMGVSIGSEMPHSPTRFNWSSSMLGAYHESKMVTGNAITEGDVILALKENGFRSNGFSSVRAALRKQFGDAWWNVPEAQEHIRAAATPSMLYDVYVNTLHGWYAQNFMPEVTLHGIVHLSGGGIAEKLGRDVLFARGFSAKLDTLFEPPPIMKSCAVWRGFSDIECYTSWHGGQGMLLILPESDVAPALNKARDFGIQAQIAGRIVKKNTPEIALYSKFSGDIITLQ